MNKLTQSLLSVHRLEELASDYSVIHDQPPMLKLSVTFIMLICILTVHYDIAELLLYVLMMIIVCVLAHVPFGFIIRRSLIGLPFSLCIGISNLILMRDAISVYGLTVTSGLLSMIVILLKTALCLSAVFLLSATTSLNDLGGCLVHLKIPGSLVLLVTMVYRYLFVLAEEARTMMTAYLLRHPQRDAIEMKHMGSFAGSLLMRSLAHAQEVSQAMQLRGFCPELNYSHYQPLEGEDYFKFMMCLGIFMLVKVVV